MLPVNPGPPALLLTSLKLRGFKEPKTMYVILQSLSA
jgi:hypothetical protein